MPPTDTAALTTDPFAPESPPTDLMAEPAFEECVAHHSRYFDDTAAGRLSLRGVPHGHYIAYHDGLIHDHDADPVALLNRVAARLGVHPARVLIHYPWMW